MSRFVLITRHPADCEELQQLLAPGGLTLRPYPVLRLEDEDDGEGWAAVRQLIDEGTIPQWLLLASPRAPERWVRMAEQHGLDGLIKLPAATVGASTARAAEKAGLAVELIGPGTGLGLAKAFVDQETSPRTALFACGRDRRPELPQTLAEAGHTVLPVVVYRMVATPPRELPPLGPSLEAVVLTSPRAAALYLEGVGGMPLPCQHWALGPTTRQAAVLLGIDCRIPDEPTMPSLAEELCKI
jgi:uroporphyrinogen-III synthase